MNKVIISFSKIEFIDFIKNGEYKPASLTEEGFIHCCLKEQLEFVAHKFFSDSQIYLVISNDYKLGDKLKYENGFPHLYRKLLIQDIVDIASLNRESGTYKLSINALQI